MNENTKLYVFARKEVALISTFIILMVTTAFIFGVKIGKHYSFEKSGLLDEDQKQIELLSKEEEMVEKLVAQGDETRKQDSKALSEDAFKRLKSKIDSEFAEKPKKRIDQKKESTIRQEGKKESSSTEVLDQKVPKKASKTKRDELSGKYTIQLGSHRSLQEAQQFADAFKVRGYDPIINEVSIDGRGIWFRVSIGVFSSTSEARQFINKEQSLFTGQDYVISEFD